MATGDGFKAGDYPPQGGEIWRRAMIARDAVMERRWRRLLYAGLVCISTAIFWLGFLAGRASR